ncbi:hypothetical protein TNIN_45151 [Trichonephila inaurata madagascariensis]|uniref:Uncharacterized protein n=1 Tax=Trichonephila inaurata madagascariensis TaxID=2747483 RepID=A0A8X6YCK3_9ARAC|nr:hypothetical protein TNIN_45151 [Trichonephila inaurata madagascariensis]
MSSAWLAYRNYMTELGELKMDILYYFAFRLSIANTLLHGLLKKLSATPLLAEDKNDELPPKLRVTTYIPHQTAHNNEARRMCEIVGDRNHRNSCGNEKCLALTHNCTMYRLQAFSVLYKY